MPDEPTGATAEPVEEATSAATPDVEAAADPEPIDWDALDASLATAYERDPKAASERLKKHRAISGLAGSLAERRYEEIQRQRDAENQDKANQKAREDLEAMARERPLEFADKFLTHADAEKARQQILNLERATAQKMMSQIGEAYHGLPEWGNLTDDEKDKLRQAVDGAADTEAIARFNKAALDIVADRRAEKRLQDRLPKEQEAWKKEWEAERLTRERGPDLRRPSSTTRRPVNWQAMSDEDFNKYYKERFGR